MELLILIGASLAGVVIVGAILHFMERDLECRRTRMQEYLTMYRNDIEHRYPMFREDSISSAKPRI